MNNRIFFGQGYSYGGELAPPSRITADSPGALVRAVRAAVHETQKEAASHGHTKQSGISRLEHDEVSPSVHTLSDVLAGMGYALELTAVRIPPTTLDEMSPRRDA